MDLFKVWVPPREHLSVQGQGDDGVDGGDEGDRGECECDL